MSEAGEELVGAIDQGTSSTRFLVFTKQALLTGSDPICSSRRLLTLDCPQPGWVQIEAEVLYQSAVQCINEATEKLKESGRKPSDIKCIGITNQRETCMLWNQVTGEPYCPAMSWQDGRTRPLTQKFTEKESSDPAAKELLEGGTIHMITGLYMSEYSCCTKLVWMLENLDRVKADLKTGNVRFGTVDSWLIWKLTQGESHVTDVSNASRTNFMSLKTLNWHPGVLQFFGVPASIMPQIKSNSDLFGKVSAVEALRGVPITGCMGDQHASLVGHNCLKVGRTKNTYGTGMFLLTNIGYELQFSKKGVLTTMAYQFGKDSRPCYAMEGSIAVGGQAVTWLKDNMEMVSSAEEAERLASEVENSGGVYFVPAFSGLFAPHWDSSARGTLCGLTHNSNRRHIARAVLESMCFQTKDVLNCIKQECPTVSLPFLRVDGGATKSDFLLQLQADVLGIDVHRPSHLELTASGAGIAAAIGCNLITFDDVMSQSHKSEKTVFKPRVSEEERAERYEMWSKAVDRCKDWLHS